MIKKLTINRILISFGLPSILFTALILLTKTLIFKDNAILTFAVTFDLLISVPLIFFLLIRKSEISKTTIVPLILIGFLLGSYFLPKDGQSYLVLFKTLLLPLIELTILLLIGVKFRNAIKRNKALSNPNLDFFNHLKSNCSEVLPRKISLLFATEIAVFYYGFCNWKKIKVKENEFSYHKNSGTPAMLGAFILVIAIETMAFHFLLARWSITAAWILTAMSAYTAIQVFGFAKSLSKRPIVIGDNHLVVRYGMINEVDIVFEDIESIELSTKTLEKKKLTKTLSPFGEMEGHNLILTLKKEYVLVGLYGLRKRCKTIAFYLDEPKDFKKKIDQLCRSVVY